MGLTGLWKPLHGHVQAAGGGGSLTRGNHELWEEHMFPHPEEETQTVLRSGRKGLSLGLYQICELLGPSDTRRRRCRRCPCCCPPPLFVFLPYRLPLWHDIIQDLKNSKQLRRISLYFWSDPKCQITQFYKKQWWNSTDWTTFLKKIQLKWKMSMFSPSKTK